MLKQYKVSFNIKGGWLTNGIKLNKRNLKKIIYQYLSTNGFSYYGKSIVGKLQIK